MSLRRVIGRASQFGSLALFAVWLLLLRPVALGGTAGYVIVTGASMEPGLHAGDLVISLVAQDYAVGDAVVYRIPVGESYAGRLVVHRILGGDQSSGFVLQGDNAAHVDPWGVASGDIVGRVVAAVPAGGRLLMLLRNPFVAGSLAAGFAFVLVAVPSSPRRRPGPDEPPSVPHGARRFLHANALTTGALAIVALVAAVIAVVLAGTKIRDVGFYVGDLLGGDVRDVGLRGGEVLDRDIDGFVRGGARRVLAFGGDGFVGLGVVAQRIDAVVVTHVLERVLDPPPAPQQVDVSLTPDPGVSLK